MCLCTPPENMGGRNSSERSYYIADKTCKIERRLMTAQFELPEALRMYQEVIYSYKPAGDPTWPLRSVRDIHVKLVRNLHVIYSAKFDVARKVSLCVWFEAWRRSDVLEESMLGHRVRFVLTLLQTAESSEEPYTPEPCKMMKWITVAKLQNLNSLLDENDVEAALLTNNADRDWVSLELQTVLPKPSDDKAYIYVHFEHCEYIWPKNKVY